MAHQQEWSIVFYIDEHGFEPVREFLRRLDLKTQARFDWAIEQLRVQNVQAGEPLVRHVEGKLWELRRASGGNIYRVFYFFFAGRKIVLLSGFQKKTQKMPQKDIAVAQRRMEDFLRREAGDRA